MKSRRMVLRILKKITLTAVGAYTVYKLLYWTGLLTLLRSLWGLAVRSGVGNWIGGIFG